MDNQREWIDFDGESFSIDASLIANGFDIGAAQVHDLLRARKMTSRCERGIDQDAGRYRLTFYHGDRTLRFIVDERGEILQRMVEPARAA